MSSMRVIHLQGTLIRCQLSRDNDKKRRSGESVCSELTEGGDRRRDRTYHAASTGNDSARRIEVFKMRVIVSITDQRWVAPHEKTSTVSAKALRKSEAPIADPRASGAYHANYGSRLTPWFRRQKIIFGILSGCWGGLPSFKAFLPANRSPSTISLPETSGTATG